MTKYSGVGGVLSVGHTGPEGVAHGHSYEVVAWYRHGHDARLLQSYLKVVLDKLDHTVLPDELRLGENIAEHIGTQLPGCVEVEVNRPLERIYARWTA
jgi:6-pyruvoyl-tetrahydropterin synthase